MSGRSIMIVALACAGPVIASPTGAPAAFSPMRLVSASATEQAARDSLADSISADGRYAVFQTGSRNIFPPSFADLPGSFTRGGVFRKDLAVGGLELVAAGDLVDETTNDAVGGAANPSVSADGRYVAFQTNQRLVAADVNDATDVYVRDMESSIGEAGALDLVSALDGTDVPPTYATGAGAIVAASGAISRDGTKVVFASASASNLPAGGAQVPAKQIFVRDLGTRDTHVVSAKRDPLSGEMTTEPAASGAGSRAPIARISADGSTAVWAGYDTAVQAPYVDGNSDAVENRFELFWRRIAAGASAPTRRVSGADDRDDPACPNDGTVTGSGGPCDGPMKFAGGSNRGIGDGSFSISGNGRKVAFTTDYTPRATPIGSSEAGLNAFVADMGSDVSRKAGLLELTRERLGGSPDDSANIGAQDSSGNSIAISDDGRWVAFPTQRTRFLLPTPTFIGPPPGSAALPQLYAVDLISNTIQLVSRGLDGNPARTGAATAPSVSADGSRLVFVSAADDMVSGDSNSSLDVFVSDFADSGTPLAQSLPPAFEPKQVEIDERLRSTYRALRRGAIAIDVVVPAAGTVKAIALARIGKRRRRIAGGSATATRAGTVTLKLRPSRRAASRARRAAGLPARVSIVFRRRGAVASSTAQSIPVLFRDRRGVTR